MPCFARRLDLGIGGVLAGLLRWTGDLAGVVAGQTAITVVHLQDHVRMITQEPVDALALDGRLTWISEPSTRKATLWWSA